MWWLLLASVRQAIEQARSSGVTPTAEQLQQFEARFSPFGEDGSPRNRLLTIAGDTAEIAISGVMTNQPDFFAMLFGGGNTTYTEIISALVEADQNDQVKQVVLAVDSPGGTVDGLFDAIAAIETFSKPITSRVTGTAASAAYALVSQTNSIEATNRAVRFGSVGIAATIRVSDDEVTITSTEAPKKRPDVTTAQGQAVVREELDALHQLFVESIAEGRDTTFEKVNAEFGQGATLLADEALKRGMIDAVAGSKKLALAVDNDASTTASGGNQPETDMDLQTLKAQHPAVYEAAMQEGVNKERERVAAHLIMGEASGDMKTAISAAKEGTEMTASINATYLAAGMNRSDTANRQDDDDAAGAAADNADDSDDASASDSVVDLVAANLGYVEEA